MIPPRHRFATRAVVILAAAALLASCAASPPSAAPDATPTPVATEPAPEPSTTPEPEPAASDEPTCETLIGETVVEDFASLGWTSQTEPFYIGSFEVAEGIQCVWADFDGPAGDHGQMFGWARISDEDASATQSELVSQGWIREEGPEGVYITESPATTITTDDEGYGMTYLYASGWVKLADTKQGLLLIEWPKS
ncbi:hypothetical protein [Microbacterium gallinarum]|uniref:Nitrate ABC transporter substrate-binding protein n=1 Tax=Microbacterium gallinarum TaxID=2762209 RepID=A0ABR8X4Y1_9MICO|nr:hypothetical protein [Microbacterium gallinarum]MBD8024374.1 hypothetical protein [Microbacterium gallinarum]